jgi:heme/copper-type cytochrome/quinol oxidase subunit 3
MEARFFRIAYAVQFLLTLMATFEVWAQVGGQGHLDLMPWYYKLLLAFLLSLATVKATAAAVRADRFWNRWTSAWLLMILALIVAMGLLTYYEHLHEPADEGDETPSQIHLAHSRPQEWQFSIYYQLHIKFREFTI